MKIWNVLKVAAAAFFFASTALAQTPGTLTNHAFLIGKGAGQTGFTSLLCGSAQLAVGQSAADPICRTVTGDVTITAAGVTAIGAGKVTPAMVASMTSAELATIISNETGSGLLVFATSPVFTTPNLGTPSAAVLTNATGLPLAGITAQGSYTLIGNFTGSSAVPTASKISALTDRAGFGPGDKLMIEESTGEIRKVDYNDFPGAGSLGGSTGATDNAAIRADGTGGATVQSSALLIADTTASLSRSGNGGIPLQGTNTNDSASAGYVGEFINSVAASPGSAIAATTATTVTSISLTAGDWDVVGWLEFDAVGGTSFTQVIASISLVTNTLGGEGTSNVNSMNATVTSNQNLSAPTVRASLTGTTTYYLVARSTHTVSNPTVYGHIQARRMR